MNCTNHPEVEAQGMCAYCGKPFCKDCLVEVKGRMYCKKDLENVLDEAKQSASGAQQPIINIANSNANSNSNANTNANTTPVFTGLHKSRTTALILCILGFFGVAGLHRMYVGKVGSGVLHLLTGGICVVGTILDLISICSGGFRDCYGHPLV